MTHFAVLGYGTVGSGVAEVFFSHREMLRQKIGKTVDLKYILDLRDFPGDPYEDRIVHDFSTILEDREIGVVAEVMGGLHPAYEYTKALLERGKSVVTSNKELVAHHGAELITLAKQHDCNYFFEAAVGGGIPIIRPLHVCLGANQILSIDGILNGTTNYILTKMLEEGKDFTVCLKDAQAKGYAERNPAADVEGHDACRKIAILASIAFNHPVHPDQVSTEGIVNVDLWDAQVAGKAGYALKLIAHAARMEDGRITACVAPMLVKRGTLLGETRGVFNAVRVVGDAAGELVFYGQGAGKLPTASAVAADMLDCALVEGHDSSLGWPVVGGSIVASMDELVCGRYYRCLNLNRQDVEALYGDNVCWLDCTKGASGSTDAGTDEYTAFLTEPMAERFHKEKEKALKDKGASICSTLRVLGEKT